MLREVGGGGVWRGGFAVVRRAGELHLAGVYRKLGIEGRRQLAEALAAGGVEGWS
ncbi:hypothetical protein Amsp01_053310 [Amycolatopsis sp. NBRC 101858]|nr:hypothetical protein Amsp01_053310 [Amycolatopsis sp. NBRC 101858]